MKTLENIKKGSFVVQYVGEVITSDEAEDRGKKYDAEGRTYLFDLDFNLGFDFQFELGLDVAQVVVLFLLRLGLGLGALGRCLGGGAARHGGGGGPVRWSGEGRIAES